MALLWLLHGGWTKSCSLRVQAMERAALIMRTPSQTDKRSMVVSLTSKGRRLCPRIREIWSELERMTFGGLTARQRADLAQMFTDVRQGLPPAGGPYPTLPASDDQTRR